MLNYKAVGNDVGLPPVVIRFLKERQIINDDLDDVQMFFMQSLASIFGSHTFIKLNTAALNHKERAKILFTAGHNKIESYIITRLMTHYAENEAKNKRGKIYISQIVDEVLSYYKIPVSKRHDITTIAHEIRRKVCNMRYRRDESLDEITSHLTKYKKVRKNKHINNESGRTAEMQRKQNEIFGY
jgi:hypothetical protein